MWTPSILHLEPTSSGMMYTAHAESGATEEREEREGRRERKEGEEGGGRKRWVREACNSKDVGTLGYC